jgi:hypothetical protein
MIPFFITGLPRSRTAWLANFLTTDHSFCYHDLSRIGLNALYTNEAYTYVGDADSGLLLHVDQLLLRYPNASWLFLHNTVDVALKSYQTYFQGDNKYLQIPLEKVPQAFEVANGLYTIALTKVKNKIEIDPVELDNITTTKNIWQWLLPTIPWNEDRYAMLNTFRINVIPQKLKD